MYNKKTLLSLVLVSLIAMSLLSGCKKENKEAASAPAATAAPAAAQAAAATPTPTPLPSPTPAIDYKTAAIKDVYTDYFKVGAVLNSRGLTVPQLQDIVKAQFNSLTLENEMKPDSLLDYMATIADPDNNEVPAVNFRNAEPGLKFAKDNKIQMRGHTLIWHSQTPRWLFTEGFSSKPDAPFASREVMLKRMENYIKAVMEYANTNYPGVIYAWDVVNEAIEPGDGDPNGLRTKTSLWYQTIGEDYIEKAFEFARKYADPSQKLFYNDYGTESSVKAGYIKILLKKLIAEGNIDGIGMQTHIQIDSPSLGDIDTTARAYAKLGLELQITELDMDMHSNTPEDYAKQATRYRRMFIYFKKWVDDGLKLTSVTFWGTTDDRSWLNTTNQPTYPLLFDKDYQKKPAFFGVIQDPEIPIY